jgi:hypothetical protein
LTSTEHLLHNSSSIQFTPSLQALERAYPTSVQGLKISSDSEPTIQFLRILVPLLYPVYPNPSTTRTRPPSPTSSLLSENTYSTSTLHPLYNSNSSIQNTPTLSVLQRVYLSLSKDLKAPIRLLKTFIRPRRSTIACTTLARPHHSDEPT